MDIQLKKGLLEMCVLACINSTESYGYKIMTDISPVLDVSESTLYPILKRLEAACFVTVKSMEYNGRLRKYYSITGEGKTRLVEFLHELKDMETVSNFITSKIYINEEAAIQ